MNTPEKRFYDFGPFRIDAEKRTLLRNGEAVPLAPKAFDTLLILVRHPGQVLEKDRLIEMLWPDSFVEEGNLTYNISAIRKALGESPNERRYVITVPGRGYRFAADVEGFNGQGQDLIVERYTKSSTVIQEQEASPDDASRALPAPRFASVRLKAVLASLTIMAVIILLASGLWLWLSTKPEGQPARMPVKSLAVLPFRQLGAEGDEYLGLGIADSLITLIAMNYDWDWQEAEARFQQAIALNPHYATARHWYGEFLGSIGRFDEGIAQIKEAEELDPLSLIIKTDVAKVYYLARRYDLAVEQLQKALEMDSSFAFAHFWLAHVYLQQGRHEEALAEAQRAWQLDRSAYYLTAGGMAYALMGKREEAIKVLNQVKSLPAGDQANLVNLYTALGDRDRALAAIEKAMEERSPAVNVLRTFPTLDPLRSDPRFQDLMRRVGLAD